MSDISKALGGYTETPWGWVDDSPASSKPAHVDTRLDVLALAENESKWTDGKLFVPTKPCFPSFHYGKHEISYFNMRGYKSQWTLWIGTRQIEIKGAKEVASFGRDANGEYCAVFTKEFFNLVEETIKDSTIRLLKKGLFKGFYAKRVTDFLRRLPSTIKPNLRIGDDYQNEDYQEHIDSLCKMDLRTCYVSDIVAVMIYMDPKGCIEKGPDKVVEEARALKAAHR